MSGIFVNLAFFSSVWWLFHPWEIGVISSKIGGLGSLDLTLLSQPLHLWGSEVPSIHPWVIFEKLNSNLLCWNRFLSNNPFSNFQAIVFLASVFRANIFLIRYFSRIYKIVYFLLKSTKFIGPRLWSVALGLRQTPARSSTEEVALPTSDPNAEK